MISKKEITARRLAYFLEGLKDEEFIALQGAEVLIDAVINETTYRKSHGIPVQRLSSCFAGKDHERNRELLQILFCKYENAGWSISLNDELLILE